MASEDVLERAEDWLQTGKGSSLSVILALAAEVRALRAKLAAYENHPRDETEREIDIIIAAMASRGEDA